MKRVALCMRGAVSKYCGDFSCENSLYTESEYIDYVACYNSIYKHIIDSNPDYVFDIFCHCWNTDLEDNITKLYKPVRWIFEDNRNYNKDILELCSNERDFGGISQAFSIKQSIELKEEYEKETNNKYDIVILYRYDVLLWKNINLNNYIDLDTTIYVNGHEGSNGDFHFIMNSENSHHFKKLYNSIKLGNSHRVHFWIKNYVLNYMKKNIITDDIIPGKNQEVLRKIHSYSIDNGYLSIELFNSYKNIR